MKISPIFSLLLLLAPVARADEPLNVQVAPDGETSITYRGLSLVPPGGGKPNLNEIYTLVGGGMRGVDISDKKLTVDVAQKKFVIDSAAARVQFQYIVSGEHLHIYTKVDNKTDAPFNIFSQTFFKVALPGLGQNAGAVDNQGSMAVAAWQFDKYVMALGNWEAERPVRVALEGRAQGDLSAGNLVTLTFRPSQLTHPIIDSRFWTTPGRDIAAHGSDTYHFSLDFGASGDPNITKDVVENFRKYQPSLVNWPDRRPIGRVFLANPTTGWKNNPRGYIFGKGEGNQVGTPEGHEQFTKDLYKWADYIVAESKKNNAQGVIIWDIEGAWMPHPITYIGHPQMLPFVAPEMAPIADGFFKILRDAGLKTGICIRPTEVYPTGQPWPPYNHRDVKDPVALMSDKIQFAKDHWGCTMFYLDSNVTWQPTHLMPASMLRELKQRHPDVLIIPEWEDRNYYRYAAGYGHTAMGGAGAPPDVRAIWPESFNVIVAEADYIRKNYEGLLKTVKAGDVMFFQAWFSADENALVNAIHQEAAWSNAPIPADLQRAAADGLLEAARDQNPQTRFQAAQMLGKSKDPRAVETLTAMIDDPNIPVARNALRGLAEVGKTQDLSQFRPTIDRLIALLTKPLSPDRAVIRGAGTGVLTSIGKPVVDILLPIALDPKQSPEARSGALATIGMTGYKSPDFIQTLIGFIKDGSNDPLRMSAMQVSMALRLRETLPAMADVLRDANSSPQAQTVAVQNLGIMARATEDFTGIEAMTLVFTRGYGPQLDAGVKGTTNYHLGDATGQKFDGMGWRYLWLDRVLWETPTPADTAAANDSLMREARILHAGQPAGLGADAATLAQHVKDPDVTTRYYVAQLLGNSKDPAGIAALGKMLADPEPLVQFMALASLRKVGQLPNEVLKQLWPIVMGLTPDNKPMPRNSQWIRYTAFGAMATQGEEAAKSVADVAQNQNEPIEIRIRAVNTLHYWGKEFKTRTEGLQKLATDPNPRISAAAASALKG